MMFAAFSADGWTQIIGSIFVGASSLLTLWIAFKLKEVKSEVVAVKGEVGAVKAVAIESVKLANGNMGAVLKTVVISAQALAIADNTPENMEKVAEAEKQLADHQLTKNQILADAAAGGSPVLPTSPVDARAKPI